NSQKDHIPVVVAGPRMSASVFAEKDVKTVEYSENQDFPRPFYYLALSKNLNNRNLMDNFPECPVLYRVERSSVALSVVKKCHYPNRLMSLLVERSAWLCSNSSNRFCAVNGA